MHAFIELNAPESSGFGTIDWTSPEITWSFWMCFTVINSGCGSHREVLLEGD
jgi:hypothetical protein